MPEVLTSAQTRSPSGPTEKIARVTGWTSVFSIIIPLVVPGLQPMLLIPLAGALAGIVGAIGSEIRNHQHTYESGGKRDAEIQGGFWESILNILGKIL